MSFSLIGCHLVEIMKTTTDRMKAAKYSQEILETVLESKSETRAAIPKKIIAVQEINIIARTNKIKK